MRFVNTDIITQNVKEMCIEANYSLSSDVSKAIHQGAEKEDSDLGKQILLQLKENMEIAAADSIPICQDTGMAIVFAKIGQNVVLEGEPVEAAINNGIRLGYQEGYLRKSVVGDPLIRDNTNDNTPGIIHYEITPGDKIELTVAPKGFGSENMSRIYMLKPSDGVEGVKKAVLETVQLAGPNACPPIVVGVGIGGSFEKAAILSKKALTRSLDKSSPLEHIKKLEEELLAEINETGIGPGGFGGKVTALGVNIETYPTHIAGLPVAINICCHVNRHISRII
ncbi:fumarate hydratase [Anaerocolumna sp. AGMB13020]|uniref:fumarate hydratase n=1 Tax=Anaerocolumna sp. AGMB13020 TaxID=3081750 RepID=UPI0029555989|nr:fumarate hydratase [Anaerocolumna sp. AGMB13020]WOO34564.1 fumarate hydratase [Anaerocolumna sp. AGMB13020]